MKYFIKNKDSVTSKFQEFRNLAEQSGIEEEKNFVLSSMGEVIAEPQKIVIDLKS